MLLTDGLLREINGWGKWFSRTYYHPDEGGFPENGFPEQMETGSYLRPHVH